MYDLLKYSMGSDKRGDLNPKWCNFLAHNYPSYVWPDLLMGLPRLADRRKIRLARAVPHRD